MPVRMSSGPSDASQPPFIHGGHSDTGQRRQNNEDAWKGGTLGPGMLLVVCDGVGGANAGEVASRLAVDGVHARLQARWERDPAPANRQTWLDETAREMDRQLRTTAQQQGLQGMGATLSALWLDGSAGWWVQTGDSRIYRLRGNELRQISRDQSPVGRLRASGQISEAEARKHPYRHMIDQCLGGDGAAAEPETGEIDVHAGDVFLLCSDGLSDGLWDKELAEELAKAAHGIQPQAIAQTLVQRANAQSGNDNITAVVAMTRGTGALSASHPSRTAGPLESLLRLIGISRGGP